MKAIIAAWWFWTRMLPITKTIPKEMMPVWTKPVIQYIVEWLVSSNIKDLVIITSQWKQALEDYFDKNYELEQILKNKWKDHLLEEINKPKNLANICFVKQKQQLWFAHAILEAKQWVEDEYFVLSVGDTIFDYKIFEEAIALHKETGNSVVALKEIPIEDVSKYWVVKLNDWCIEGFVEKPLQSMAPSNLIIVGIYILPKRIFGIIEKLEIDKDLWEILLTDAMDYLIHSWEKIMPYITTHRVLDVWTPQLWLKANNEIINNWM